MGNSRSPDMLSDLPLGIIHIILSLLPIRDAIRTSFLSRQWRYIWASLPDLVFDQKCVNPPMRNASDFKRLDHFISQALFIHKGPIHKFKFTLPSVYKSHGIDQWLLFIRLYSCQYLTHLELQCHRIPPPPQSFKGFVWLRSLKLHTFKTSCTTVDCIVAHSPLLEKLILDSCEGWELNICAPNPKYFNFKAPWRKSELSMCTPLLEELIGDFEEIQSFSIGSSLEFPNLRIIDLSNAPFDDKEVTPAVIQLITSSPNLQKLEISSYSFRSDACASLWDAKSAPDFTYDNLKVIKLENFCGALDEMKLIRFLLERSPVLKVINMEDLSGVAKLDG